MKSRIIKLHETKKIPAPFGNHVELRPFLHPHSAEEFDQSHGKPAINYSFGHFTIKPGTTWPATVFTVADVYYILSGSGIVTIDGKEMTVVPGDVVYVAPHATRSISNPGDHDLTYLSIVDPAWNPEFEKQV